MTTEHKFATIDQVRDYLAGDRIICLVCGKALKRLQFMHLAKHGLDADGYRERFGIPWTYSLTSAPSRQKSSDSVGPKQLKALMHDKPRGGRPGQKTRPRCPAAIDQWSVIAEVGRDVNARTRVKVQCSGNCGTELETTRLTAAKPIYCNDCASTWSLRQRAAYYKRKALAAAAAAELEAAEEPRFERIAA